MKGLLAAVYTSLWVSACLAAVVIVARAPRSYAFAHRAYWRWLAAPWKLASFAIAAGFFVFAAPYTGDPTWDWADALLMSVLTFLSAPWAVGAGFRVLRAKLPRRQFVVAACAWLLSASWSYDAYILLRKGFYPPSWFGNAIASSVLYLAAGLMWNLAHVPGRGVVFGFMDDRWPELDQSGKLGRVLGFALAFMILVAGMMVPFVWNWLPFVH